MIIGTIELDPEDPTKQIKITDDIGFNPSRRNIIRNQNFNNNIITEKMKDDVDKLSYKFLQLPTDTNENNKGLTLEQKLNITKYSKLEDTDKNFYTEFLYPDPPNINRNNVEYDGGTFLTDKISLPSQQVHENEAIKENIDKNKITEDNNKNNTINNTNNINNLNTQKESNNNEIYSTGFESIPPLKHNIPVSFDKLIVNLSDEAGKPKPLNPLFFIINGERPIDKTKSLNFRTNPSLFTTINRKVNSSSQDISFKKRDEDFQNFNKSKKYLTNLTFTSSDRPPQFITSFNKAAEDKKRLNYDLKKAIFNDPNTQLEDKYKLLKDFQRNELMNRALGRGIFSCNKFYDDEKRALNIQKRKRFEQFFEDSKDKMVINLRSRPYIFDDRKKSFPDSQSIVTHDYLKLVKEEYKKTEGYRKLEIFRSELKNRKMENLYRPKIRSFINKELLNDTKVDKVLKRANFEYSKPYDYQAFFEKNKKE